MNEQQNKTHIVAIGAGYAGLLLTMRLAGKTRGRSVEITLVNALDTFTERVRLHQYATNQPVPKRPLTEMLRGTGVRFVHGCVTTLNTERREIRLQTADRSQTIGYDHLVYALGSTVDTASVPGVRENAYTLTPYGDYSAETLRSVLPEMGKKGGRFVVVGGGPTGVESAAEFADAYPNSAVTLLTDGDFGAFSTPKVARYMRKSLTRHGVSIHDHVTVTEVKPHEVVTSSGEVYPFDLCLWAGGFVALPLAREAGLKVNERGQILVDPYLRSISHPEIYAVGDSALPVQQPGAPMRMSAVTAIFMGAHGADCLVAAINGKQPKPFGFSWLGQGIALGRHDAVGFNNYPNDCQWGPIFTGRLGFEIREVFVRLLAALPMLERRWPGCFYWLGKGRGKPSRKTIAQRQGARGSV